ncbi:MAG: ribosome recycling factor [Patescibacteria group bacterium]
MNTSDFLKSADKQLARVIEHLGNELAGLQIGRASSALVESVQVEAYGSQQPLKGVANISVPDAKTLFIEPWDRSNLTAIEKAITDSPVGLNPNNDGVRIILNIPPLTEERRAELTKLVGQTAEEARISVRRSREDLRKKAKAAKEAEEITEDEEKLFEKQLQEKVDEANKKIDRSARQKEEDMMTV